ncbi:ComGF family competence protein [Virgibacillus sp. MSJ-26]|uniref:ComGF family competence protein n=1 Tax=Virgibacillus sp. MSJ-26 TaxID=2841522 RepID=UPI001C111616|nr:ComGF family competence protein [Virgibacillus sp. MSJ-26]MBU5466390.1 ComGF family competence protein [Virgibacillus sp. MSJ-26]
MSEKKLKKNAYSVIARNEFGFSMISMLTTITIIFISLPFLAYLLNSLAYSSHQEMISTQQFFLFLRDELTESPHIEVINPDAISYELKNGDVAEISFYNNLVRRRVEEKGHEIYLRDIDKLMFKKTSHGMLITVSTMQGEFYEKQIFLFQ